MARNSISRRIRQRIRHVGHQAWYENVYASIRGMLIFAFFLLCAYLLLAFLASVAVTIWCPGC